MDALLLGACGEDFYSVSTALAFLGVLAGLGSGHLLGDIVLQTDRDAISKGMPGDDLLAAGVPAWTGWVACLRHVASYLAAQAGALLLVLTVIPLTLPGIAAALAVSGATHAVIDRRWPVQRILAAKGCTGWDQAPFWVDQALHWTAMLIAAAIAARVSALAGPAAVLAAAATGAAGLLLIGQALRVERRHAARAVALPASCDRL